jgi:hypothetical protein
MVRDRRVPTLHVRDKAEWIGMLERMGMGVEAEPMSAGTPFANVLLVARRGAATDTSGPRLRFDPGIPQE